MKKLLFLIVCIIALTACTSSSECKLDQVECAESGEAFYRNGHLDIVTIKYHGEAHEYLRAYHGGGRGFSCSHWESCKYCKQK